MSSILHRTAGHNIDPMADPRPTALTVRQASEATGLRQSTILRAVHGLSRPELPARSIDGRLVVLHRDLEAWVGAHPVEQRG